MSEVIEFDVADDEQTLYVMTKNGWESRVGHSMTIFGYSFAAIPYIRDGHFMLSVTEVVTGLRLFEESVPPTISDKDSFLVYLETVTIARLSKIMIAFRDLDNFETFNERVQKTEKENVEKWGEKPEVIMH